MFLRLLGVCATATLVMIAWVSPVLASPLNLREVPADVKWVAHVDADAFRASPVMRAFFENLLGDRPAGTATSAAPSRSLAPFAFDKLQSVTIFGKRLSIHNGAAIVRGKWNKDELLQVVKARADVKTTTRGRYTIYSWTRFPGTDFAHEVALAFPRPDVLVFAADKEMQPALDALEGKGGSLALEVSLAAAVPPGTIWLARAAGMTPADVGPHFAFFRNISGFDYHLSDQEGRYTKEVMIVTTSEQGAAKLKKVFDGMLALADLAFADNKAMLALLDKSEVKVEGHQVRVQYQGSSDELIKLAPRIGAVLREPWELHQALVWEFFGQKVAGGPRK